MPETKYRELADRLKAYVVDRSARLTSEGDVMPMWEIVSKTGEDVLIGTDDNTATAGLIPSLVREHKGEIVGNVFFGYITTAGGRTENAIVMVIDPERTEMWYAPVIRSERSPIIGPWKVFGGGPGEQVGGAAAAIQEAMR